METASTLQAQDAYSAYIVDSVHGTMTDNFPEQNVTGIFEDNHTNITETFDDTEIDTQEQWERGSQWWGRCICYGDWKWQ